MPTISARQGLQTGSGPPPGQGPNGDGMGHFRYQSFWWSKTGEIIKWSIFFGALILFFLYMGLGYWHAKQRIRKGLQPLRYHRWLLNRQQRGTYDPNYQNPPVYYYAQPQQYGMQPMPPPMYDPRAPQPPNYQPPTGATKIDPSQWTNPQLRPGEPLVGYASPPGPPPAAVTATNTGSSGSRNNLYRV